MSSPASPLSLPKEEYRALPSLYQAIADVAAKHGKVILLEGEGDGREA